MLTIVFCEDTQASNFSDNCVDLLLSDLLENLRTGGVGPIGRAAGVGEAGVVEV